jgi:hypothetical protein
MLASIVDDHNPFVATKGDLLAAYGEYLGSLAWRSCKARTLALGRRLAGTGIVEIELNLGAYIGGAKG